MDNMLKSILWILLSVIAIIVVGAIWVVAIFAVLIFLTLSGLLHGRFFGEPEKKCFDEVFGFVPECERVK